MFCGKENVYLKPLSLPWQMLNGSLSMNVSGQNVRKTQIKCVCPFKYRNDNDKPKNLKGRFLNISNRVAQY